MACIRVLIADVESGYRAELRRLVFSCAELELVASAMDADDAVELLRLHQPGVAVLHARMPGGGAARAVHAIRSSSPGTAVVLLAASEDSALVTLLAQAVPVEHLARAIASPDEILAAIKRSAARNRSQRPGLRWQLGVDQGGSDGTDGFVAASRGRSQPDLTTLNT